jgi:hypothetical protein
MRRPLARASLVKRGSSIAVDVLSLEQDMVCRNTALNVVECML